jgi:predicted O-methyltransferase YrrM
MEKYMDIDTFSRVDKYYQDLLVKPDPRYAKINLASLEAGLPTIQITSNQGMFLQLLVKFGKVKRILEIGTLGGFSTAWLAGGLSKDGKIISLEIDPFHAEQAKKNLSIFDFEDQIEILVGDGRELLQTLIDQGEEPFDIIFIDAAKDQYSAYLKLAVELSQPGTLIIADNVVRRGSILNHASTDQNVKGILDFNQTLAADPRLSATVLQTVGEKGYDGFNFIMVKSLE